MNPFDFEESVSTILNRGPYVHGSVTIGEGSRVQPTAVIEEGCTIGDNCFIGHHVVMRPNTIVGSNTKIGHLCVFEGETEIGNDVLIHAQCHITKGAIIENKVFLGPGVIGINDRFMCHERRHVRPFVQEAFIVRRAARIGSGAIILPRVEIGENSVVGAGSVVTKNVAPRTIVFGCPARFVMMVEKEMII